MSENSSVAPCGCVIVVRSRGAGRHGRNDHTHLTPALIINVLCQKKERKVNPQASGDEMCFTCKEDGRCLSFYRDQSVVDMRGVCSHGRGVFLSLSVIKRDRYSPPPRVKWIPMSGGGDRGGGGLEIRKY